MSKPINPDFQKALDALPEELQQEYLQLGNTVQEMAGGVGGNIDRDNLDGKDTETMKRWDELTSLARESLATKK
jgi:hypothetical protein